MQSDKKGPLHIKQICAMLEQHFTTERTNLLPIISMYSIYELLFDSFRRYNDKRLLPLQVATNTGVGLGHIQVYDKNNELFESVMVQHPSRITAPIVQAAYDLFKITPVRRYYILTIAEPNIRKGEESKVKRLIGRIYITHGCEVIVNGILPTLKYYLRLISDPITFLQRYSENLQAQFAAGADIKEEHMHKWQQIREGIVAYDQESETTG